MQVEGQTTVSMFPSGIDQPKPCPHCGGQAKLYERCLDPPHIRVSIQGSMLAVLVRNCLAHKGFWELFLALEQTR